MHRDALKMHRDAPPPLPWRLLGAGFLAKSLSSLLLVFFLCVLCSGHAGASGGGESGLQSSAKKHRRGAGAGNVQQYVMNVEWQQDEAGNLRIFRNSDPVVLGPDGEEGEGMGDEDVRGGRGWCACCGPKAEVVTAAEVGSGQAPRGRKEGQRALPCCC